MSTSTTTINHGGGGGGSTPPPPTPGTIPWARRLVDELYLEVLSRTADGAGEAYWIDQVMARGQGPVAIAHALLGSVEYRTNLVQSAYWQYLGRGGDSAGIAYWVDAMGRGTTDENVRLSFIGSNEFWTNSGGNPRGYVDTLYTAVLQRTAEPSGEAYWVDRLNHGAPAYSVAASLIGSTEMLEQRIAGYYLTYLSRTAGSPELAYWAAALAGGTRDEDVILGFVGSNEFLSRI
ncbi:MAG TPA: DUF4214 domain-containing protein [Candidatus Dormibacteraeota bacterium]